MYNVRKKDMRTSPVHYIAPSAVSITPNANQSPRDLAVHVARGTKIKVCYQPIADLGYNDANYKEWTLRGRNRRLAESGVPYTIYARLNKTDQADGYLVFAQKEHDDETDEWSDPYILSPNTSATSAIRLEGADGAKYLWSAIPERQAASGRSGYWWIRLGSVSAPDSTGQRSVDFDSGILGTAQYNMDWYLNPDNLPTRPVREIFVDRGEWTAAPTATYTGSSGKATPDGTLDAAVAAALGWEGAGELGFENGQQIAEPYHYRHLTRDRWLTHRLADYEAGYTDAELYEKLTTPSYGWEEENWVETSRVWYNGRMWECLKEGTAEEPGENSKDWRRLLQSGEDGADGYSVELTKSSDSAVIDPSGNVIGGYRNVSKDASQNEFYSYRFFTSVTVMRGGEYLHLCGALDDDEQLGEGNFTVEAIGAGCDLKVEGSTVYITGIWHCNDGDSSTPNTSYSESPEEYQLMRTMTEAVAHITLNIEGKTAVTKDYRLQLVHLPTDTVVIESHNEVSAINWSTKKNNWTNQADIEIPLTASSGGQPVRFQTVNGGDAPDIRLLNTPGWLTNTPGYSVAWADYDEDGDGRAEYTAAQHMAVKITIPIRNIRRTWTETGIGKSIDNSNLLRFNVTTVVDGVEYENIVPFTLNVTTDKAVYVLAPSVRQVIGTMIGGTWDKQSKTISNARYSYSAGGQECSVVKCSLMAYDDNNAMTEITSEADIHDSLTFLLNGKPSTLAEFRAGLANTAVTGENHTLYDELSEIVFAIRLDGKDYESEGVPILRNGAQISIGDNGNWYVGGVNTEVFAKGTEVIDTKIYYTDPMDGSTPPAYTPTEAQRGKPVSPYLKTQCPASVEGKFIHYVSITIFSDSEETYVYSYGTIGTGNTITVIHDRDYYASDIELTQAQLRAVDESKWSESTPADYSSDNKYLYGRDAARYYKNGAEQTVTVGGIAYPKIVYTLLSYWGQDGSGVEFAYYRADDESAAKKPTADVLNQRHAGTAKNPVIPDWNGSDGGWYDDNPGFTAQGQVMYQSVNKYSNGQWSGWGDPVIIDRYAQNSVRLDIDNEMDMVATDSTGQITAARTVETVVRLYDGSKEVDISAATLTVAGAPAPAIATQTAAASGKGKKLSWAFKAGQPMAGVYNISIAYTYNGTAYTAAFTVSASKGQAVWQLKPSMSSIAFQRTASNALTPASRDVSLKLVKIDGASTTEYSSVQTGVAVRYSTSSMPASGSDGTAWTSGNISVPNTADNLYVALFNAAGTLLDRETVPVVKDGENGQNSVRLDLDNEMDMVATDSTGQITAARTVETVVRLYDGSKEVDISAATLTVAGAPAPAIATQTAAASGKGKKLSWAFKAGQPMAGVYNISIAYTYNGTAYTAAFTVSASKGQAVWQLKPSMSSIAFQRTASNALTPASRDVSLKLVKIDGASTTEYSSVQTGVAVRYSTSSMPASGSDGTAWTSGNISVPNTADNLYVALFNAAGTLLDRETVPVVKDGENGKNSVRLDLDNEHQDFLYDDTGNNLTGSVTFYPRLYDGTSDRSGSVEAWQVSANDGTEWDSSTGSHSGDTMTASINAGNRLITVSGLKASTAKLLVRALYQGTYYYAEFTANRASQDTYELVLNPSSIAYNPASYAQKTISISATRLDLSGRRSSVAFGTGEGNISTVAGRGTLRLYATYGSTTVQITTGSFSVTASLAAASTSVYFELRKYSGTAYTIVDYETIPINKAENGKDGGNGQNAVSYKISCVDTIKPGDDYFNVSIIRSDGASVSRKDLFHAKNDWGVTLSCTGLAGAVVEDNEDSQVNVSNCTITGSTTLILRLMLNGVIVDEKHVRGVIDGADGNPGHVGRWYYYAEEWADGNPYTMQETQAPFVKRHTTINGVEADYFFMLDFGTRGISTGSTRGEDPASHYNPVSGQGTEPWTLMQSTMQYYIAQAFFGPYAHFGSFIINSDWLVSTNGKIGDTEYVAGSQYGGAPAYLCFDSRSPFGPRTIGVWSSAGTNFYNTAYNQKCDGFYVGCSTLNLWVSATLTGGTMSLAVYSSDGVKVSGDFELTGSGDVNVVAVGLDSSKSYHLRAKMSSGSYRGTISRITEYPFVPNFAVDGLTGKTYQNDAYVRGTVKARLFYGETLNVGGESPYTIDLDNNPYYTYIVPGGYPDAQEIILPAPEKYDGCELKFFIFSSPSRTIPTYCLKGKLMFIDKDNYYRPTVAEEIYGSPGEFLIIKSFDGYWLVVSGI